MYRRQAKGSQPAPLPLSAGMLLPAPVFTRAHSTRGPHLVNAVEPQTKKNGQAKGDRPSPRGTSWLH